jgi:hypothetical protein
VVVLTIGIDEPLLHELLFEGNAVRAGQVWLARRAGSTAGPGGKRRPGGVADRLIHRLRRRRRHRESPALIRDADTRCVTAVLHNQKNQKPGTFPFCDSAAQLKSSLFELTQINLSQLVGRAVGCES